MLDVNSRVRAESEVEIEQVRSVSIQGCPQDKKRPFPENRRCRDKRWLGTTSGSAAGLVPETNMCLQYKAIAALRVQQRVLHLGIYPGYFYSIIVQRRYADTIEYRIC